MQKEAERGRELHKKEYNGKYYGPNLLPTNMLLAHSTWCEATMMYTLWTSSETAETIGLKADFIKKKERIPTLSKTGTCVWDKNIYKKQLYMNKQ